MASQNQTVIMCCEHYQDAQELKNQNFLKSPKMTAEEPNIRTTGRYSVNQAAEVLGVHRNTIRRWTESGLLRYGIRTATGRKFFQGSELLKIWQNQYKGI